MEQWGRAMTDGHAQESNAAEQASACGDRDGDAVKPRVTFSTFILSLASSALVQLGEVANPETGGLERNLGMARHSIDILCMLQEKTRECLDSDESRLLDGILYDLRMKYVLKKG
jgi:hypothetical protein